MSNLGGIIKSIQNIMRQDMGLNGDARAVIGQATTKA